MWKRFLTVVEAIDVLDNLSDHEEYGVGGTPARK